MFVRFICPLVGWFTYSFGVKFVVNLSVIFSSSYTLDTNSEGWIWFVCYSKRLLKLVTFSVDYDYESSYKLHASEPRNN